jgi:3-hydroxybutyryl-CoA dehydrogenase
MKRIGVIGAGVMGNGVSHNLAATGHEVVLVDVSATSVARAREEIHTNVRMAALLGGQHIDPDDVLGRIHATTDYGALEDVEFVVENATEKWDVKHTVYRALDASCPRDAVIAANTSAIPITRLASLSARPERVLGIHFMNPVPLKPAVELIPGVHTSEDALDRAKALLAAMGKRPILVKDAPGFVSNRVLMLMVNEAAFLVHEGVATADQVDDVFRSCFDHRMGPLELADLIGIDTILFSVEVLHDSFGDSKYRPCPLLRQMVDAGLHGRKSGQGFFSYQTSANTNGGENRHVHASR